MTDEDLVRAYVADAAKRSIGVDYYLAQEMERRGLRSAATRDLTAKAKALLPAPKTI